jgi:hypothetical protein
MTANNEADDDSSPASAGLDLCFPSLACLRISELLTFVPACKDASPVVGDVGRALECSLAPIHREYKQHYTDDSITYVHVSWWASLGPLEARREVRTLTEDRR